jgi:hypothetical protein
MGSWYWCGESEGKIIIESAVKKIPHVVKKLSYSITTFVRTWY